MGRPAKLDDIILLPVSKEEGGGTRPRVRWEVIVERIRSGIPPETAALSTGVSASTYYRWMQQGEDRWEDGKLVRARPTYRQFREATTRARAEAESVHVARIAKASETDWKASAWYLERAVSERWRRRDTVYGAGPADGDPEIPVRRVVLVDPSAAGKLAELVDLVERASAASRPEGGDGSTT